MRLHDSLSNAQTQPGPGYLILDGGTSVKSFENPDLLLDCNTWAVIRDLHSQHAIPRMHPDFDRRFGGGIFQGIIKKLLDGEFYQASVKGSFGQLIVTHDSDRVLVNVSLHRSKHVL